MDFVVRHRSSDDESFIYSSFLNAYYENYPVKLTPRIIYFPAQSKVIARLLEQAQTLVAVFPEDANEIMAYALYEERAESLVLHWLYVKRSLRGKGIASKMLAMMLGGRKLVVSTHIVDDWRALKGKLLDRGARMVFDPYVLEGR